jgi:hypothetical protein
MGGQMVDVRQPRFGQAVTGASLLIGFVAGWTPMIPIMAVALGAAALGGPRINPYAHLFRLVRQPLRIGPPRELEEAWPPRFANTVGFLVLAAATLLLAWGSSLAAWVLALLVSALALLAAVTGLCVGCEIYVFVRRLATRGRVPGKIVVSAEGTGTGG